MSLRADTLTWFAAHELRLAWRDVVEMMTGGRRSRALALIGIIGVVAIVAHLIAAALVGPWIESGAVLDRHALVLITGGGVLLWTVMLSQALESVTRAYYTRSDLDLILSSPASSRRLFAVRAGASALLTLSLALLLASPMINVLAWRDGLHWLAAYPTLAALAAASTAIAVVTTLVLFGTIGPRRTRLAAQIIAAVVGAGFVIGLQVAAIFAYGGISRFAFIASATATEAAPGPASPLWLFARAATGDPGALVLVVSIGATALALALTVASRSFGRHAVAAGSIGHLQSRRPGKGDFVATNQKQALRRKEWRLLARDPWLLSQTMMQILYLVPPALLLWVNFGAEGSTLLVVAPVVVMACGQLAGGLAWLAISGEDAHDLVVTAPLASGLVLAAKVEAVTAVLALVLAPVLVLMMLASVSAAAVTGVCAVFAAASATAIQLWFRTPMRRAMFRRRQVASRIATLSEAFVSIMWAGVAALLVSGGPIALAAVLPALLAAGLLGLAYGLSPKGRPA